MSDSLRIALLGAGRIARVVHVDILRRLSGVKLVAVADADSTNVAAVAARVPGIKTFTDFAAAIGDSDVDAVVVALPPALHEPAAVQALRAKKHVYLEKPIAINADQARSVLETWRASSATAVIGFNYRFHPLIVELVRAIRAGDLGEILAVRTAFAVPPREQPAWRATRTQGGGTLLELGSHHLDLIHVLFGSDVASVSADIRTTRSDADTATVHCRLDNGILVQSFFSIAAPAEDRWEIISTRGRLLLDREAASVTMTRMSGPGTRLESLRTRFSAAAGAFRGLLSSAPDPSHERSLAAFVEAVRGGTTVAATPRDGWRSLSLVLAAEQSAADGRAVDPRTFPEYATKPAP